MTKAEELKQLEKIEKLIAEAGPDSYISIAFKGIAADARENITNDWGNCKADRVQELEAKIEKMEKELAEAKKHDIGKDNAILIYAAIDSAVSLRYRNIKDAQNTILKIAETGNLKDAIAEDSARIIKQCRKTIEEYNSLMEIVNKAYLQ